MGRRDSVVRLMRVMLNVSRGPQTNFHSIYRLVNGFLNIDLSGSLQFESLI